MRVTLLAMCLAGTVQADEAPMRAQEQLRLDGFQAVRRHIKLDVRAD